MRRRGIAFAVAAVFAAALWPSLALAHGLAGRADLPIPSWLFGWAAAIVLGASFAALAALWPKPRLQRPAERRICRIPAAVDVVCGLLGIAAFAAVVYAGLAGTSDPNRNLAPTVIYIQFWVGVVVASLLLGDVFRAFNPWRALARALAWIGARLGVGWSVRPYPEALGRWPAALGIALFAWLELVYQHGKDNPAKLAVLALAYAAIQLIGMAYYGIETWSDRADAFGVYFNLYSRLSVFERRDGVLYVRPPLSGAPSWRLVPGSVALLCVAIGSTTFDGFSNGLWQSISPHIESFFKDLGAGTLPALELAGTVGLLGCIGAIAGFYRLGIEGMKSVDRDHSAPELLGRFAHTLIPIAFAYALAHYFSLLVFKGQQINSLISNPLGHGSNLFGTTHATIHYFISGSGIWYVQVGALICGHVCGLVLAHDRAVAMYSRVGDATRSQYWMLVVMVGFTSLGLWLLSAVHA